MSKVRSPLGRAPTTHFRTFVGRSDPVAALLPLTHMTDAYGFRDIAASGVLRPMPCPVFREALLYLFYGRPAFRKNVSIQASRNSAYAPVCLVIDPAAALQPVRVFPFDTGAFDAELFGPFFHNAMALEDFGLEPDVTSAGRLVKVFFETNERYFQNRRSTSPQIDTLDFEVRCYDDLIQKADEDQVDERLSTIEIQLAGPVDLRSQVIAAAVPETFLENRALMTQLADLDIEPLPYMYVDRWRPIDCTSAIYTAVRDFYRRPPLKVLS